MKRLWFTLVFLSYASPACSQTIPTDSLYLGQIPPGSVPKVFDLFVNAGSFAAERIAISNDGREIYYTEVHSYFPVTGDTIRYYRYTEDGWTGPFGVFDGYLGSAFSMTCDTIYLQHDDAYFSIRNGTSWTAPQRFLNGFTLPHYLQVTGGGQYYISSVPSPGMGGNDWCRLYIDGADTTIENLGLPLSSAADDLDFYVAKDESYMIVAKASKLWASFHKADGHWTNPKSLGPIINFGRGMWGPYVSSDNQYLFYSTGIQWDYSDVHVYWVRIDSLLDSLSHSNFTPYMKTSIPDQRDTVGHWYSYTIPDSVFVDDDGSHTLTFSASLHNGNPLPSWLTFDSLSRTFSGTPTTPGSIYIKVRAMDTAMASVSGVFRLTVAADLTSVGEDPGILPKTAHMHANYPNPFNPTTTIAFDLPEDDYVTLRIFNAAGQLVTTLIDRRMTAGRQEVLWNARQVASGAYFCSLKTGSFEETRRMLLVK